jgi:hypothetical protein
LRVGWSALIGWFAWQIPGFARKKTFKRHSLLRSSLVGWSFRKTKLTEEIMAKPSHKVKKANHGKRPANNRGRKAKNKKIKTP